MIGDLNRFAQFQTATAIGDAAKQPGDCGCRRGHGRGFAMASRWVPDGRPTAQQTATRHRCRSRRAAASSSALDGKQAGPFTVTSWAEK